MLKGKRILLIVTGGIAAFKAVQLARLYVRAGATVRVVMTTNAQAFVTAKTFAVLTGESVITDLFDQPSQPTIEHINLADWADYQIVVPATANLIAKMAQGIADDAASTVLLARHVPTVVIPAMNSHMWSNPALVRNIAQLRADGVHIIEPVSGLLAEGYAGQGRMPEPEVIFEQSQVFFGANPGKLANKTVVVTAGGTREAIDPVRYIGNHSSGKTGYAIAQAAVNQGAHVILITTVDRPAPALVTVKHVVSALDMLAALKDVYAQADVVVMAAAVADYRLSQPAEQKMKKTSKTSGLHLDLVQNPDILAQLGQMKTHQFLVGFAAETQDVLTNASKKLQQKRLDLLVANDVSQPGLGFATTNNVVTLLEPGKKPKTLPEQSKTAIARELIDLISERLG
ncbi:bifunctional phosphopantothenoylcysteine decarboxylase/phosphopantothenate--cysteine ligase CoaBC [Weissella halotolerans]|uniref:Coenzyme A biosynthesis bifunctional protein CoaBC n=1 Tax=Weissella halotolerans DSM 20190 TaxID=1123500 RepID=A0A0R2FVM1_9LACO|nr:bifunctional phosphopantothenoylcysteine decarboxylase/phosphopantothenate--cysteine ligase CoaBC [Weissella halotolerans]KRN31691.1 phosphopantothenoylcysteine decarboxylase phosphopantothenate-cysteine ligase [Weissella halotolerans DSM 20190]